jgi:hypothetical protein
VVLAVLNLRCILLWCYFSYVHHPRIVDFYIKNLEKIVEGEYDIDQGFSTHRSPMCFVQPASFFEILYHVYDETIVIAQVKYSVLREQLIIIIIIIIIIHLRA